MDLMEESDSEEEEMEDNSPGLGVDFSELITLSDSEEEEEIIIRKYKVREATTTLGTNQRLRRLRSSYTAFCFSGLCRLGAGTV